MKTALQVVGVAGITLVCACSDRSVNTARDAATFDLFHDVGAADTGCACIPTSEWKGYGVCGAVTIQWGCRQAPSTFKAQDVVASCWNVETDAATGCKRPETVSPCGGTCPPPPPPKPKYERIGDPCASDAACGYGLVCLMATPKLGVCAVKISGDCGNDTPLHPKPCEELSVSAVCGEVPQAGGSKQAYCFRPCKPKVGSNGCKAPISCSPESGALVGRWGEFVCLEPGCGTDADCPVRGSLACDTKDPTKACPAGSTCEPHGPAGTSGLCAKPGTCDKPSGLCVTHTLGTATAKVGDPCNADTQCAGNMRCLVQRDESLTHRKAGQACLYGAECCSRTCEKGLCAKGSCVTLHRGGYCTIEGCAAEATLTERACPTGSACNNLYPGGQCQPTCSLADAKTCRGQAGDLLGDYECRAWNNFSMSGAIIVAKEPVCDHGPAFRCSRFSSTNTDCSYLGTLKTNPTKMTCRGLDGKELTNKHDPSGFCLDTSSSGTKTRGGP